MKPPSEGDIEGRGFGVQQGQHCHREGAMRSGALLPCEVGDKEVAVGTGKRPRRQSGTAPSRLCIRTSKLASWRIGPSYLRVTLEKSLD